jgi:chromosome segregation ATPase
MSEVREEIMSRLQSEREDAPVTATTPEAEEPIVGDPEVDGEPVGEIDDTDNTEAVLDPEAEALEGDPVEGEVAEVTPEYTELQEKYKSLEAEFSRVTANRREIESSLDNAKAESVRYQHELQDKYKEAEQFVEHFAGMANQQLQQLSQVNPSQLSQEQYAQFQQAYQQAQMQSAQFQQLSEQVKQSLEETLKANKMREAEIARERIKTRIPDWSTEKYKALGDIAGEYGYTSDEFFDSTDYRMILLLNDVQKSREAAQVVGKKVAQTKSNPPKNRNARQQDRNAQGQFTSARDQFYSSNPGQKGAFAAMKAKQLRAERQGK